MSIRNSNKNISKELSELAKLRGIMLSNNLSEETSVSWLNENKFISSELLEFCKINRLFSVGCISRHMSLNSDFTSLSGCTFEINDELIEIAKILNSDKSKQLDMFDFKLNPTYSSDISKDDISIRAYNVCMDNRLTTLNELNIYFNKHGGFFGLSNCGAKTNDELISLIRSKSSKDLIYENKGSKETIDNKEILKIDDNRRILSIVESLTKKDRVSINHFILFVLSSLSKRTVDIITEYYNSDFRVKVVLNKKKLIDRGYSSNGVKITSKTYQEIRFFYEQVFKNITLIAKDPSEVKQQFLEILNNKSKLSKESIENIDLRNHSGIKIIDILIKSNLVFGDKTEINLKCLNIYDNFKAMTLEEVGGIFCVTRERIRQVRVKGLQQLEDVLKVLRVFFGEELYAEWSYNDDELIKMSESHTCKINNKHDVSFSKDFITYLYSLCSEKHSIIPRFDVNFLAKMNNQKNNIFNDFYFVNTTQSKKLDFGSMIADIKRRKEEKVEEDYTLDLNNYLRKFLNNNMELDFNLIRFSEQIIMEEAGVFVNSHNELEFDRNVSKTVPDYAYEILKEIGQPSKIDDVYKLLIEKYPDFDRSENTFRGSFNLDSRFVPIGRQSVWGLKEWESERDDFLGGTMLEMAENILQTSQHPVHISEIANEIAKYRNVDHAKLMANLKFNNQRGFVFFEKQYVGLKSKKYLKDFEMSGKEVRPWETSYTSLKGFIEKNNRLPKASDSDFEVARIYRWYGIQRKRYFNNELEAQKIKKIEEIIFKFDNRNIYE